MTSIICYVILQIVQLLISCVTVYDMYILFAF